MSCRLFGRPAGAVDKGILPKMRKTGRRIIVLYVIKNPQVLPTLVHICSVVVEHDTSTGRINKGLATAWLRDKMPPPALEGEPARRRSGWINPPRCRALPSS